ncbi:hypothetical protein BLNAU_9833 [Blattamonas nauphoetae]|uniref:Uncharacterized protein n=1 Tax=Blattamonas nauphoetae TaxID=2049346 RepID=A0ABQ9XUY2_9EUKA|nr:hypothetical protein BLNAU_9833 [Blattamonas nauphoetae]
MEMLNQVNFLLSAAVGLALVKADLIPQIITTLNPQSLSFVDAVGIHTCLVSIISYSLRLSTPDGLNKLRFQGHNEQQAVHETVLQQIVAPSAKYICHLCVNRYSIVDWNMSNAFMVFLARLLRRCAYYHPTMDFVLHIPVVLTIPSCLTFLEDEYVIWYFLYRMNNTQLELNKKMGETRQMWKSVHRMLRMEGIEDVTEEKLQNHKTGSRSWSIVAESIRWSNMLGVNLP